MNYWTLGKDNIFVAAHRGWSAEYPENTMEAFIAAEKLGVDQIETDVRISKDGELVLIHDSTLDRTTNGTGLVCDKTLAELKELDAGSHKGEAFKDCRIPTFKEFMDHFKDHPTMTLDIELKEYPSNSSTPEEDKERLDQISYSVCDRVLQMVDEYGYTDRVVINTFSAKLHEYIFKKYGKKYKQHVYFPIKHMGETTMDPYSYGYCCCMFANTQGELMADLEEYEKMSARGVSCWAGASVKDEAGVEETIKKGAHLITCNNPDIILELLKAKGYHK